MTSMLIELSHFSVSSFYSYPPHLPSPSPSLITIHIIQINEAYECLSDEKKKSIYDRYGEDAVKGTPPPPPGQGGSQPGTYGGGFGGFDPFAAFGQGFGGAGQGGMNMNEEQYRLVMRFSHRCVTHSLYTDHS